MRVREINISTYVVIHPQQALVLKISVGLSGCSDGVFSVPAMSRKAANEEANDIIIAERLFCPCAAISSFFSDIYLLLLTAWG